jgi:hypothetical protein
VSQTSHISRFARASGVLAAVATLFTACITPVEPPPPPPVPSLTGAPAGYELLACPTSTSKSTSKLIIPILGGIVSLDGTAITLPSLAILSPTTITVALPASSVMRADITAGNLLHFLFQKPVQVTIDYSRCGAVGGELTVWHYDPATNTFLEDMGGVDDRSLHKITFTTDHLSSYAIANRTSVEVGVEEPAQ